MGGGRPGPPVVDRRRLPVGPVDPSAAGVFVDTSRAADPTIRRRAALAYVGGPATPRGHQPTKNQVEGAGGGALSYTTALTILGSLDEAPSAPVHVTVGRDSSARSRGWLVVHRQHGFNAGGRDVVIRRGFPIVRIERSLVEAWPVLRPLKRREAVIRAVNERLTTTDRLTDIVATLPRLPGRAELSELIGLLAAGCRSELEIWGHYRVFTGPGMPRFVRQRAVTIGSRTIYLDVFAEAERVDFELDGASVHADPRQREIDLRRDAALAAQGILVVRFTHQRLINEPERVRREVLAILQDRGQQIW